MDFWFRQSNAVLAYALAALLVVCLVLLLLIWWLAARRDASLRAPAALVALGLVSALCLQTSSTIFFRPEVAPTVACLAEMKQAAMGVLLYANDFDDRVVPTPSWQEAIGPYLKKTLRCPALPETQTGLGINRSLLGKSLEKIPENVILFTDSCDVSSKSPLIRDESDVCIRHTKLPVSFATSSGTLLATTDAKIQLNLGKPFDISKAKNKRAEYAERFDFQYRRRLSGAGHVVGLVSGGALFLAGLGIRFVVRGKTGRHWALASLLGFTVWLAMMIFAPELVS